MCTQGHSAGGGSVWRLQVPCGFQSHSLSATDTGTKDTAHWPGQLLCPPFGNSVQIFLWKITLPTRCCP